MPSPSGARDATAERRRRTIEYGYRVCGHWEGELLGGRPRICVMPVGHDTSPHRDALGDDFATDDRSIGLA